MDNFTSINQDQETPPRVITAGEIAFRYTYGRSADCRQYNDTGQDYICFSHLPGGLAFALCDGVSQSFMGDLAAKRLGNALVIWLSNLSTGIDPEIMKESLSRKLTELSGEIAGEINDHPLPESTPAMLRTVLEEKRSLGSESTFVCGRIDLPNSDNPEGSLIAAWMGDSRLRLWNQSRESWQKSIEKLNVNQRWSSRLGPVGGEPNILAAPLMDEDGDHYNLAHIMVYSDGLAALDKVDDILSNEELTDLVNRVTLSPQSDDISLFEIWLGGISPSVAEGDSSNIQELRDPIVNSAREDEVIQRDNEQTVKYSSLKNLDKDLEDTKPGAAVKNMSGWKFWKKGGKE